MSGFVLFHREDGLNSWVLSCERGSNLSMLQKMVHTDFFTKKLCSKDNWQNILKIPSKKLIPDELKI